MVKFDLEIQISKADVQLFAEMSGDINPNHIDDEFSLNQFGRKCAVHGAYLCLLCIEYLHSVSRQIARSQIVNLTCSFIRPIEVDSKVRLVVENTEKKYVVRLYDDVDALACRLELEVKSSPAIALPKIHVSPSSAVVVKSPDIRLESFSFETKFFWKNEYEQCLFRYLISSKNRELIEIFSTASRITGTIYPGKYAILTELVYSVDARACDESTISRATVDVETDARVNLVSSSMRLANRTCIFNAVFAKPVTPLVFVPFPKVKRNVRHLFRELDRTMVIIGGSGGVGTCLASWFLECGVPHLVTMRRPSNLSKHSSLAHKNSKCRTLCKYDIFDQNPTELDAALKNSDRLDIFYLATPRIFRKGKSEFSETLYKKFMLFYFSGLESVILQVGIQRVNSVFIPSSVLISEQQPVYREYVQAKKDSIRLIREKYAESVNFFVAKLEHIESRQSQSVLVKESGHNILFNSLCDFLLESSDHG